MFFVTQLNGGVTNEFKDKLCPRLAINVAKCEAIRFEIADGLIDKELDNKPVNRPNIDKSPA
ncbi:hypothetical protein DL796_02185 [Kangiella spongicola]|uniref:Uncharacterized protein n=1 Tax=Kangiella spongicola TaxID=796379 RepID=A0A318D3S8_9GAMM|nr:hypothetical protein DL796_02185 [Kangiella spongicola]